MFIPDPGSRFLPIPDLPSRIQKQQQKRGKNIFVIPFYVATNFKKFKIILGLRCWRKKFGQIFKEQKIFLPKKLSLGSQNYGFGIRDPGSEIRDPEKPIPDPESRGQKGTGSWIRHTAT